jgi:hypothetical protein
MSTSVQAATERGTRFQVCPRCKRRRKMRILRPRDATRLEWLNCLACNGLVCFEVDGGTDTLRSPTVVGDFGAPAPEEFRTYVPEDDYRVGEFIYHQTWRDVGKVIRKRELAGGRSAIDVAFLNFGPKMLIVESEAFVR